MAVLKALFLGLFLSCWLLVQNVTADELYLVIGQSNASGRGQLPGTLTSLDGVLLLNDRNQFVPTQEDVNVYSTVRQSQSGKNVKNLRYSFAYTFGQDMQDNLGNNRLDNILLVSNARGSSPIRRWQPNTGDLYEAAVQRAKTAERVSGTKLTGVIWHQGESDAGSNSYGKDLQKVIDGLRKDFNNNDLPFVAGELSHLRGSASFRINDQMMDLKGKVKNFDVVSARNLKSTETKGVHFDTPSLQILGRRYAAAMQRLI